MLTLRVAYEGIFITPNSTYLAYSLKNSLVNCTPAKSSGPGALSRLSANIPPLGATVPYPFKPRLFSMELTS